MADGEELEQHGCLAFGNHRRKVSGPCWTAELGRAFPAFGLVMAVEVVGCGDRAGLEQVKALSSGASASAAGHTWTCHQMMPTLMGAKALEHSTQGPWQASFQIPSTRRQSAGAATGGCVLSWGQRKMGRTMTSSLGRTDPGLNPRGPSPPMGCEQVAEARMRSLFPSTTATRTTGNCSRVDQGVSKNKKQFFFRKHMFYTKEG